MRLKGLNKVSYRSKVDGRLVVYWYAWKGGPKIETDAAPGSAAFMAAYNAAVAQHRAERNAPQDTLAGLVARYRAAPEFTRLAQATRDEWVRWLDRIALDRDGKAGERDIGGLPFAALDDRRVKAELLDWRDQWADRPRAADYAMQVLSRVLSWAMGRGLIALNAAAGVEQLYRNDRADQVWTAGERAAFRKAAPSPEVGFVVELACLTGLRLTDLTKISDTHVSEASGAFVIPSSKSRGRRTQVIPLLPETRELLAEILAQREARLAELTARARRKGRPPPPRPTTILSNTRGRPWTPDGLEAQVVKTKAQAGVDKHLHDAKGTFGTRLRKAGLKASQIADVLGWEEARVERLLKTYVDQAAIVRDIAEALNARKEQDQ